MGSPLVVELAEIRVADVENTALTTYKDPPNTYRHFVDDGIGDFRDKSHADGFLNYLNSLTDDLQYTIEYPSHDGSLPYIDILIHADKSTSVYRKPTHTNLFVHYNSCAPSSSKDSVIRSLTFYKTSSHPMLPPTLTKRTGHSLHNLLTKWTPPDRVKRIMDSVNQKLENPNKLTLKQFNRQLKATTPSLTASFPFHPTITKKIKKSLASHDVKVTSSSGTTLRDLLTKTKTTPPPHLTPNVIYEISCNDCTATYNGQTNRPLIKRIKVHESHSRLHLHNPDDFSHNQSAPAHHSQTTGHKIAWDRTTILTTTRYKTQLDLTEHTAIKSRNPSLNRTDSAPTCSKLWDPIIPKIACTIKPRPAGISFPKKK